MINTDSKKFLKTFGLNVKKYRVVKKMTQEQLAEAISTSSVQIGRVECGKNACTIHMLLKLCMALDVTPNSLFSGIEGLPLNDDNNVFVNRYICNHNIQSSETKNFLRYIVDYFDAKNDGTQK